MNKETPMGSFLFLAFSINTLLLRSVKLLATIFGLCRSYVFIAKETKETGSVGASFYKCKPAQASQN